MIARIGHVDSPEAISGNALGGNEVSETFPFSPQLTDKVPVRIEHVDAVFPFVCFFWGENGKGKK